MTSDDLIRSLASELTPVRRLRRMETRALGWSLFALLCVGVGSVVLGLRSDVAAKLGSPSFVRENAALLLAFAAAGWSAFQGSIPGRDTRRGAHTLALLTLLVWLALVVGRHFPEVSAPLTLAGFHCVWRMVGLALAPTLSLLFLLLRAAPLERGWTGSLALLSVSALAMLGTQLSCAKDEPVHVLVWHCAPVLLSGFAGVGLGELLFRHPRDHALGHARIFAHKLSRWFSRTEDRH